MKIRFHFNRILIQTKRFANWIQRRMGISFDILPVIVECIAAATSFPALLDEDDPSDDVVDGLFFLLDGMGILGPLFICNFEGWPL